MNAFFSGLGRFVVRFRWPIVATWIAGAFVIVGTLPTMGSQVNNDNSKFLPPGTPSIRAQTALRPIIGTVFSNQVTVVATSTTGPLTSADQSAIAREAEAAAAIHNVTRVRNLGVSPDGTTVQILLNATLNNFGIQDAQSLLTSLTTSFGNVGAPPGLQFHLAGSIATDVANNKKSQAGANSTQMFSILLILVLLFVIFRSLLAPILTLLPAGLVLTVSGGFIGALAKAGAFNVSQFTQLLLIVLMLGAGTDYGLFLVFRVREEMGGGLDAKDAVQRALHRVGESISASAGTVVFALLTLLVATFGIYHDLGLPLAIGIATMLLAGLTFLPALLAIFGRAVFWPYRIRPGTTRRNLWGRAASRLIAKPTLTLAIGAGAFVLMAIAGFGFKAGGFGGTTTAPAGSDAATGNALVAKHFPQSNINPSNLVFTFTTPVWDDPSPLPAAATDLASVNQFTTLLGPLDPTGGTPLDPSTLVLLHHELGPAKYLPAVEPDALTPVAGASDYNLYRATANFISTDGRTIQFQAGLRAGNADSTQAMAAIPQIRDAVTTVAHRIGANYGGIAGQAAGLYDVSSISQADLVHIIPIAIVAIAILLALVLRSAIAPLYLIVSVVLSYLAAMGLCVFVFIDINKDAGLTFLLPFLMFIFLLALGEDYNILIMSRIREESHHLPLKEAVIKSVAATGSTITSAGLVLAGSFSVFAFAAGSGPSSDQVRAIGFGIAAGIVMDTFVVRTVLVPATVVLLGRWNWWPSRLVTIADGHEAAQVSTLPIETPSEPGRSDRRPPAPEPDIPEEDLEDAS